MISVLRYVALIHYDKFTKVCDIIDKSTKVCYKH